MCLAALAPTVSRAVAHRLSPEERGWVQVCGVGHGLAWVQTQTLNGPTEPGATGGALGLLDACAHCALGMERSAPPPDVLTWGLGAALPSACPGWRGHAPVAVPVQAPLARAPPIWG